jgi:hypothetical protein
MKARCLLAVLALTVLIGCSASVPDTSAVEPEDGRTVKLTKVVGLLPRSVDQHPLVVGKTVKEGHQGYLDLVDNGKRTKQVIVVYPTEMKRPEDEDRLIEIEGRLHLFKASNPANTMHKRTFDCEVIEVLEWKYSE